MTGIPPFTRLRLHLLRLSAGVFLTLEKTLESLWPFLLWLCLFFSLWLLQIPGMFGKAAEIAVALVFAVGFFVLLYRAIFRFRLPGQHDIARRIEDDSALPHRPLSGLDDRLANPDVPRTGHLWQLWQNRLPGLLKTLRWPRPHPVLARRDPYALRGLAVIVLIGAIIMAGPLWRNRIAHGLIPAVPTIMRNNLDGVVLWVTPPAYTGQKQIVLRGGGKGETIAIPEGSIVKARVSGWIGQPSLRFGSASWPMQALGKGSYGIEKSAQPATTMAITQLLIPRARWPIDYVIDQPPTVTQKGEPQVQAKGELKIPLTVQDDYGVQTVTAHIRLDPDIVPPPIGTPVDDTRNVVSPPKTAMDYTPQFDLAWHPWAGLAVVLDVEAKDHKGQVARIGGLKMKLPERAFRHPVAKKLVLLRKRLIWSPEAAAQNIAYELEDILARPAAYHGDPVVFLALRSAASHLAYQSSREAVATVVAQLWDIALRVEDGNFTMARRDLRNAQAALQNALRDPNATPNEIAALMEQMRQAMGAYLQETFRELQKSMAENGADPNALNPENFLKMLNPDALAALMDKMQAQAMSGDRNEAAQMLAQMQKMMESLDPSNMQTEMPKDMQEMARQMGELQKLVDRQKTLLEQTRKEASGTPREEQESIRKGLLDLMQSAADKLGKVPDGMGKAEIDMRGSTKSFDDNQSRQSIPHQEDAIKHLSEGQKQMSETLAQRMQQMMLFSFGQGPTDPLGRPLGDGDEDGNGPGSKVKIPDQAERKKIQDILEELRKKSGELSRPEYELDYYRRLMRQF